MPTNFAVVASHPPRSQVISANWAMIAFRQKDGGFVGVTEPFEAS